MNATDSILEPFDGLLLHSTLPAELCFSPFDREEAGSGGLHPLMKAEQRRHCLLGKCEVFVYVGDRHAAFANAAGNPFHGTVANVAGTEDTGDAGFKRERLAVK